MVIPKINKSSEAFERTRDAHQSTPKSCTLSPPQLLSSAPSAAPLGTPVSLNVRTDKK